MTALSRASGQTDRFLAVSSAGLAVLVIALILRFPDMAENFSNGYQPFIARYFSHYLIYVVTIITLVTLALFLTPWGKIRLGQDSDRPEFSRFSWFAMLFSAGIGTGILFWGVAEPIFHLQSNPFQALYGIAPMSEDAGRLAETITLFHWGFHGWAVYSLVGLCLGYFAFRKGLPLAISSALYPLIGDRVYGPIGYIIDLLAIFSTLFGTAVTLGFGASQMSQGLDVLFGIEATPLTKLVLMLSVAMIATISAVSGVAKGIKRISQLNIWLTTILLLTLILLGPTAFILSTFFDGTVDYLRLFIPMGIWVETDVSESWQSGWTLFYWGWWVAWGPFVGMFFARISKGRTIREYLLGTLLIPTLVGFFFLTVLGGAALDIEFNQGGGLVELVNQDMTSSLFAMFERTAAGWGAVFLSALATFLVITWFVTSSDSATLVISTIISRGATEPPWVLRVFWGMAIALTAGPLLWFGGLQALQGACTIIAIPFALVTLLMLLGLLWSLLKDNRAVANAG